MIIFLIEDFSPRYYLLVHAICYRAGREGNSEEDEGEEDEEQEGGS